jgi:RNA polymerase sigma factor (sigma-70 family)
MPETHVHGPLASGLELERLGGLPAIARDEPRGIDWPTEERAVEPWADQLLRGETERAWDLFVDRYRRLIFSAIRRYASGHDEIMDVFAHVCAALREQDLDRLRGFIVTPSPRAQFSTWLVAVVRNQTIDWFRHRDGRRRLTVPASLSPIQQCIYERVFHEGRSHVEVFELIKTRELGVMTYRQYSRELAIVYRIAYAGARAPLLREMAAPPPVAAVSQPDDRIIEAESGKRMEEAMAALDPAERLAIELFVVEEMSAADVARTVGWPNAKAVYNRVTRALVSIRLRLERRGIQRGDL